jgi:uncharacterized protein YndB with AHSA1/START domain
MTHTFSVTTPNDRDIVMTRDFAARRELVWATMTKPEYLRRWLFGPDGWALTECRDDGRAGGTFRYEWKHDDGRAMAMTGTIREFEPPVRSVRTETFEFGCVPQSGDQHCTLTLAESNGVTSMTLTTRFPSKEARDGMIAAGMERGVRAGYDRIDAILAAESNA